MKWIALLAVLAVFALLTIPAVAAIGQCPQGRCQTLQLPVQVYVPPPAVALPPACSPAVSTCGPADGHKLIARRIHLLPWRRHK